MTLPSGIKGLEYLKPAIWITKKYKEEKNFSIRWDTQVAIVRHGIL
jgi:hypothetical protein